MFGQTNKQIGGGCSKVNKTDSLQDLITIHAEMPKQTNKEKDRGYYKVLKIDILPEFYLIFLEKDDTRYTIYSKKSIIEKGKKVEVEGTYFFELSCKDTLSNGVCMPPIANVTYFGKYLGSDLGKLSISKNLIGLIISDRIKIETEP